MPTKTSTLRDESALEVAAQPQQRRQVPEHLDQSHDRQLLGAPDGNTARGPHRRAGDTFEGRVGCDMAHGFDELGAELIARGLAGHDPDAQSATARGRFSG